MMQQNQVEVSPGVRLHAVHRPDFKTNLLTFSMVRPLSRGTAGLGAVLPFVLRRGTKVHPDMRSLALAMNRQYGAQLEPFCRKKGELQCVGLTAVFTADEALPGTTHVCLEVLHLLRETLLTPAGDGSGFLEESVERERALWVDRIGALMNNKSSYAAKRLLQCMCDTEAYGVDALGEITDTITPDALFAEYRRLLLRAPIDIIYVGGLTADQLSGELAEAFRIPMRNHVAPLESTKVVREAGSLRSFDESMDVAQGKLVLGMRLGTCVRDRLYPAALLATALFGGSTTSKLFMNVRERLSLAYTASAWMESHKGLLVASCGIDPAKSDEVQAEVFAQWDAVVRGDFSEEELDASRQSLCNSLRSLGDVPAHLEDYQLGQAMAGLNDTPADLARLVESASRDDVLSAAALGSWDSVFFLRGEADSV